MVIKLLKGDSQISAGYAVISALITVVFSVILAINAMDYVRNMQSWFCKRYD